MKDEFGGFIIDEFVGLKSKMYSIRKIDGKESNTAKRVNNATEFNEFKDFLFSKNIIRHKMRRIQAKNHKVGTYEIDKISVSCYDDKRFVLNDGIHPLAYFHKNSKKIKKIMITEIYCDDKKVLVIYNRKMHPWRILKLVLKIINNKNAFKFILNGLENGIITKSR